jgi:hypothetical protein
LVEQTLPYPDVTGPPFHVIWKKNAERGNSLAPKHQKWKASFQECQPTALGPLGTLDENVGFFVFFPRLGSPKRYPEWQNGGGTMRQIFEF